MSERKYLVLTVAAWDELNEKSSQMLDAAFGKIKAPLAKELIDGDEITKAFIRGFEFRAAGEPQPTTRRNLLGEDMVSASRYAYRKTFNTTMQHEAWGAQSEKNKEYYNNMAEHLNGLIK